MKQPTFNRREQLLMIIGFFLNVISLLAFITVTIVLMIKWPEPKSHAPDPKVKQAHCDSIK